MASTMFSKRRALLRKSEMIDAAAFVFASKGYFGASTKDIADHLGMTQSAVYYYFPSKEAALAEVCLSGGEGFNDGLARILRSRKPASDKIRAAVQHHLAPISGRRHHFLTYLKERHNLPVPMRHEVGKLAREYEVMIESILKSGIREGVFREDLNCRVATLNLLAACNSAAFYFGKAVNLSLEELGEQIAETLLFGFTAGVASRPMSLVPARARYKKGRTALVVGRPSNK